MIVYNKLNDYLEEKEMKYIDLQRALNLSPTVIAKFQKNRNCNTDTINKICEYLHVQPSEIMEWIPDEEYEQQKQNAQNAEIASIEAQIAELQAKKEKLQNQN